MAEIAPSLLPPPTEPTDPDNGRKRGVVAGNRDALADNYGGHYENLTVFDLMNYNASNYDVGISYEDLRFDLKKEGDLQSEFAMVCERHGLNPAIASQIVAFARERNAELAAEAGLKANAIPGPTAADGGDRPGDAPTAGAAFAEAVGKPLWADRKKHDQTRGLNPAAFIRKVYGNAEGITVTRAVLGQRDYPLYAAYAQWLRHNPTSTLIVWPETDLRESPLRAPTAENGRQQKAPKSNAERQAKFRERRRTAM